jgi:Dna[CI] antecedent, DciA
MPQPVPIVHALDRSEPLARLAQRLRDSQQRFAAIEQALPPGLRALVRPGPLDEKGWTLLADNSAVAAKLKQLLPALAAALNHSGWQATAIKVRIPRS